MPAPLFSLTSKYAGVLLMLLILFALAIPCAALGEETNGKKSGKAQTDTKWSSPIRIYQKTISRADGNRCSMYPSCSHYALDAFKRHNLFTAWVLTSDRLLRCGHDEMRLSPKLRVRGKVKIHDPLSANTFWWDEP